MENFSELDAEDQVLMGLLHNELDTVASEQQSGSATPFDQQSRGAIPLENAEDNIAAGQVNNSAMVQFQV
jgi:hypothetical protein